MKDDRAIKKFATLIQTYLTDMGGFHCQFNIVSSEMLRDAQKHPEKYQDLLVRVATYSAYFVEIAPEVQDDIIARMEFEEV